MFAAINIVRNAKESIVSAIRKDDDATKVDVMTPDSATQEASIISSDTVEVFRPESSKFIGFKPLKEETKKNVGLIIYPGGFVDAESYSPIARSMADLGYYAAVASPASKLMVTDIFVAEEIMKCDEFKDVESWAISGHSLGGVVACHFTTVSEMKDDIKGIALFASVPDDGSNPGKGNLKADLRDRDIKVTSIYGTKDGLATLDEIEGSKKDLPVDAKYVEIDGGNHTQFYYTDHLQKGDNEATITRDEQQEQTRKAVFELLESLSA